MNHKALGAIFSAFLVTFAIATNVLPLSAYTPQTGDHFSYSETITVNDGQGSYSGYTDQTQVTGMEQMDSVSGSNVSASYSYSYQYSSNQGSSSSSVSSGNYTWSSSSYTYVNGTDNQTGYSQPVYVWFAMDPSLPSGATFYALNTQFTVLSKNYSFQLPTEGNEYIQTIQAQGTGQYQRNDSYGVFTASYTWDEYFDPSTGYIVGYHDVEQDNGKYQGQVGSFTYTDDLYVTSTSYNLLAANTPNGSAGSNGKGTLGLAGVAPYLDYLLILAIVLIVIAVSVAARRRRMRVDSLPKHSPYVPPPASPPTIPGGSKIDLGSTPPEQVVIRDVAKVNCRYCGALIPTTADTCPYCGAPRR